MSEPTDVADHDWHIEEREHARHEARRGRRHAFEHLDPRRTALVVVDVVPFFARESAYVRGIVPRVNALAASLRVAGGTVAWVVPGYTAPTAKDREFFGDEVAELHATSGGSGPVRSRIAGGLDVAPRTSRWRRPRAAHGRPDRPSSRPSWRSATSTR